MSIENNDNKLCFEEIVPLLEQLKLSSTKAMNVSIFKINSILKNKDSTIELKQLDFILFSILSIYNRYPHDVKFENLVLQSFRIFLQLDADRYSKNLAAFISKASTHHLAPADILVLLKWNAFLLTESAKNSTFETIYKVVLSSFINLFTLISDAHQQEKDGKKIKKHNLRTLNAAETVIILAYESVLKVTPVSILELIFAICDPKLPVSGVIANIGFLTKAALNLKLTKKYSSIVKKIIEKEFEISDFFAKNCLLTKVFPNDSSLRIFGYYVSEVVTSESLEQLIIPGLEKSSLRNSELTFSKFSPFLFSELNSNKIITIKILSASKFLSQLISSLKATKEAVRFGASKTLVSILSNYKPGTADDLVIKLLEEIFKILKTLSATAIEQKILISNILNATPLSSTVCINKVINDLIPIIAKESHEKSLSSLLDTLLDRFVYALVNNITLNSNAKITDLINSGLKDKKPNLRSVWSTSLSRAFIDIEFSEDKNNIIKFLNSGITESLLTLFGECSESPLPSINTKLIAGGYAALAILFHLKEILADESLSKKVEHFNVVEKALEETETKMSCFTNIKLLIKLNTEESQEWFVRALFALSLPLKNVSLDYGNACLYSNLSRNFCAKARVLAHQLLEKAVIQNQKVIAFSAIEALNSFFESCQEDGELNLDFQYLLPFVSAVSKNFDNVNKKLLERQLIGLLIPAHHNSFESIKNGWVGICQRASMDPGIVVASNSDSVIGKLSSVLLDDSNSIKQSGIFDAACAAIASISFISPASVVPKLTEIIESDLGLISQLEIDDIKLDIWNGKDGELVVDILEQQEKKNSENLSKSKDYETLKWEQSVRKELAAKKKTVKKLTKEERENIKEQLELEKSIRLTINSQFLKLRRSLEIIICLSKEAATIDNGTKIWFPVAISKILDLLKSADAIKLLGNLATECFLTLSEAVTSSSLNSSSSMIFIGSSTLRMYNVNSIPEKYMGKPLDELLSSQLFSLKLASDKSQFNGLTLMYILPLLVKIIENGKKFILKTGKRQAIQVNTEFSEEAPEEEQLTLALEIISSNGDIFEDDSIPRTAILENLLELLSVPSKAKVTKDCFISLCQNISPNISNSDLKLLLSAIIEPNTFVRTTVLEVLDEEFDLTDMKFNEELWISCFDNDEHNKDVAKTIWEESGFELDSTSPVKLLRFLGNKDNGVRLSIGKALASSVIQIESQELLIQTLESLLELYRVMSRPPVPKTDEFGLVIKADNENLDRWQQRSGVALAVKYLSPCFTSKEVEEIFRFLIDERALGDNEALVRSELQDAGMTIINEHGMTNVEVLISIFEEGLAAKDEKSKVQDRVNENIIILYGNLARHLSKTDPRIENTVTRLLKALDTPSEDVQFAVSECIAPLVHFTQSKLPVYFEDLFEKLFGGKTLAQRRGAAYGIAGLVKGCGIKSLAEYDVIRNLTEASDDKKEARKREGVSFAFECLSQSLGALFEPYVVEILPIVLRNFGDQSAEVREATDYASRIIMKNTTSYGIKKMIPLAINNLDDFAWRTKKGSVELLGSMAYLDPAQLSSSLPTIVPEIVGVLNDSHKEVRKAADQALKKFGEVIRNPEIQSLVPTLLKAIGDPTKYTNEALDGLIATQFVHYIDGPSLALIIHVIDRGMGDRSASTKKKACQIIGNMAILVDTHDLLPYLPQLISELQTAIVDPVPQTRATAARALGSLVEKLGEDKFPGLVSNLFITLQDESRPGDRLGSAQALAEIISGLGLYKLEELLPTILSGATSSKSFVREGFMPLMLFLPVCFGNQFAPYLSSTIPPILNGLADNNEDIRDISLRAGRLIVSNYAKKAVDLLLPELEKGLSDYNSRIRLSSVELTGDLLFRISGISGKQEISEDVSLSVNVTQAFNEVLGLERRDQILSSLFVCRSDTSGIVRGAAANIWKALVANTPKTIKEILPALTQIIVRRLASPNNEQRSIAATTLGDMIKRVGGNALSQLLPTLQESLFVSDSDAKQGICIAVRELIESSSTDTVIEYQSVFVKIIREALVDPNPSVREAAAQAFDVLQESIGNTAVDEVIPQLLEMLNSNDASEDALSALQEIMATKSDVIFPILIPSLLTPPINAKALGALAQVAGSALYKRLSTIINALVDGIVDGSGERDELFSALSHTLLSVDSDFGSHPLLQQILALMKHENHKKQVIIYQTLPNFFKETTLDYSIYTEDIVTQCIFALNDSDRDIAKNSFETLSALIKKQPKETLEKLVGPAEQTLSLAAQNSGDLYAFTLPKGPNCILPIFLHGLMYGNAHQREVSANGIALIVDLTPAVGLKPFVTIIVGPLIRVIGERFSGDVKSAILLALNKLFAKIPLFLRPFIPQLQRTFIKSLSDPSNELLRTRAAKALGTLIEYQPKVDPLVTELLNNAKAVDAENIGVKTAILKALLEVVDKAGTKMSETCKNGVMVLVEKEMFSEEVGVDTAVAYAKLIGALSKILTSEEVVNMLKTKVLNSNIKDSNSSRFAVLTLNAFLKDSPTSVLNCGLFGDICGYIVKASRSTMPYVSDNATIASGKLLLSLDKLETQDESTDANVKSIIIQLCESMNKPFSNSLDTRRLSLVVIRTLCRHKYETTIKPYFDLLIPSVFACVRDPIIPVKLAAEKSFLAVTGLVEDESNTVFNSWIETKKGQPTISTIQGTAIQMRSLTEYVKRVGSRLASVERERIGAGGDKETMFSDHFEDEHEIWAIGGVDMSEE